MRKEEVVIVSGVRTAIGNYGGSLRTVKARDLAALVIEEVIKRVNIDKNIVDEVIMGQVRQTTEASNLARVAALKAGLDISVPAFTINRLCASSMEAIRCAFNLISCGDAKVVVVGGVENMSQIPYHLFGGRFGKDDPLRLVNAVTAGGPGGIPPEIYGDNLTMGITAENVAEKYNISREDQDKFALRSHKLAIRAIDEGSFKTQIVPVKVETKKSSFLFTTDERPRRDTTLEKLAHLRPIFKEGGTVTAGNSCGINDAAAAVILVSLDTAKKYGLKPLVKIVDISAVGVDPRIMGIGPIQATRKILKKTDISLQDIDLIELNEAFASQSLACIRELELDEDIVNVNGGAIALGHPLGATGARLIIMLMYEMIKRQSHLGLATLCIGGGQGMAMIIEQY